MILRLNVIIIALLFTLTGFGQTDVFNPHPNARLYPFKNITGENDSLQYLMQHFYFACRKNDVEKSRNLKEKVDTELRKQSWIPNTGILNFNFAYYYRLNGQIDDAIQYYNVAKNHFKKGNNKIAILWTELGLANCDYYLNRRDTAFAKYHNLYEKAKDLDAHLTANLAFNVAVSYHENYALEKNEKQYNISNAIKYYQIALDKNLESKDYLGASHTYCLFGAFNSMIGDRNIASSQLDSAMFYAKKIDLKEQIAFIQINQGYHLIEENKIEEGIKSLDKALEYYTKVENHSMSGLAVLRKSQAYEKTNQFELAYENANERVRYKALYYGQSLLEKSAFYETEFKTKELQEETKQQQNKLDRIKKEFLISENQRLNWAIWIIVLSFLLILSFIIFRFIVKNKTKKSALQKQDLELKLQQNLISETIRLQDEVRLRIGRDIHDGICQTITGIKLNQQRLLKEADPQNHDFKKELKKNIELIEFLYNEARDVSYELAPAGIHHNSLRNLISDICTHMFIDIKIIINFESLSEHVFENDADKKLNLVRIFQELTTNIVKHSQATEVKIQAYERKDNLIFRIEDNGIGINKKGSIEEGIGLQSIRYRIKILNGTINFENDQGLICLLKIPLK